MRNLADPFLIPNMAAAVDRLLAARARGDLLVIFGDYDVDGVTSTALLTGTLRALGWRIENHLPHRLEEGYGLSREGVERCLEKFPARLLLAVDCGSTAAAVIALLREKGIDVLVLDHHQVSEPAPAAVALVNPQLGANFRELCSAGLAFKLVHALLKRMRQQGATEADAVDLRAQLDLVALGCIADLVPLTGENRILASAGLERLNATQRPGPCRAQSGRGHAAPSSAVMRRPFNSAPRLNAAGRLEDAQEALRLLLTSDATEAASLARRLDERNRSRQDIERAICDEITALLRPTFDAAKDFVIVEGRAEWHIGVVGIVASRVLQEFYRPTIVFGGDGAVWRGSGRSIEGFDLAAALLRLRRLAPAPRRPRPCRRPEHGRRQPGPLAAAPQRNGAHDTDRRPTPAFLETGRRGGVVRLESGSRSGTGAAGPRRARQSERLPGLARLAPRPSAPAHGPRRPARQIPPDGRRPDPRSRLVELPRHSPAGGPLRPRLHAHGQRIQRSALRPIEGFGLASVPV